MPGIFISYRREDAAAEAGRLHSDLAREFPSEEVFIDVATILPGLDFREQIKARLDCSAVLLAVIGTRWISVGGTTPRIHGAADLVRIEIATALNRNIPVIPVLVQGAKVPEPEELPEDLQNLAYRSADELTHARWESDLQVLVRKLRKLMASFVAKDEAAKVTAPMPVAAPPPPPSGYDELAQLRKDLNSLKVEKKTLLTLVKTAAKQKQSWNRLTPEDLMGAIDPLLRDYDSLNSAYWYLILYGVLRFKDINGGWKYDTYRPSMKFAQIAPRGVALLNALARES